MANIFFESLSGWVTVAASVALAFLACALVVATVRMARALARPHIVANSEANHWSLMRFDVVVENCGNAPEYDVSVRFIRQFRCLMPNATGHF